MIKELKDIDNILENHDNYRKECLNLIASENYTSKTVKDYLSNDLVGRYGCYIGTDVTDREYSGNKYIAELEIETQKLLLDVFKGKYVDIRPVSGHMAGMATVLGILEPGDLVIEVSLEDWGHGLVGPMRQISQFGETIRVEFMKFDKDKAVDTEALKKMATILKPKLIIFGGSGTLFSEPIKELVDIAKENDIVLAYDAAHVTGLIAGGVFPNPLEAGAQIMFGSTHKSFPGPQGGFVITTDETLMEKISNTISPSLVTSHHLNRIPSLAASLLEIKKYGNSYGTQIINNSKALARELHKKGFNVFGERRDFTETHIILVDLGDYIKDAPGKILEQAGILVSDDFSGSSPQVRIGTPEVTRRGMKEEDMKKIADLIKRLLIDKEDTENILNEVKKLTKEFQGIEYSI